MKALAAAIIVFWLAMTGWLIRYEVCPEWFTDDAGYPALLRQGPFLADAWMQVRFQDQPIGYSHTRVDRDLESADESYLIANDTFLELNLMGVRQRIRLAISAVLDAAGRLQQFSTVFKAAAYDTRIEGARAGPGRFRVRINSAAGQQTVNVSIPDDALLYSPLAEMGLRRLQPGQSLAFKTFDPLTLTAAEIRVQALRREPLELDGHAWETTVLNISYQGVDTLTWITAEGRLLRQETPFGWTLQACTPEKALAFRQERATAADLLTELAAPCQGVLRQPRAAREIRLVLRGAAFDTHEFASPRQAIEGQGSNEIRLAVRSQPRPAGRPALGAVPESARPWLAASPFVQSDHPAIVRQARAIATGRTDAWDTARAIGDWVHRQVRKQPAASLPSALDVLQRLEGDCNEHTYLFTALARAAGLPARIHVGLAYASLPGRPEGAFYYHAWPAVFVDGWVEMDPTFGQDTVDAAHISLATGELADQLKLLGLIGRIRAEILEEK